MKNRITSNFFKRSGSAVFSIFLLLVSISSFSQTVINILDEEGETLPGSHVTFTFENQSKKQMLLSDIEGKAVIEADKSLGKIYLEIAYVGYLDRYDTINQGGEYSYQLKVDNITLNQVVITGQYSESNPEKSVHKIKVIQKEQLDDRGVVNLNDALQFETNIRLSQDNAIGSSVSIQGLSGENVKIMIDGVAVVGRQDGNIDLNQINMNNVERIEIVEGPLSVNYGSNALAGTINIITKKSQKEKYTSALNTYYESVGQYNIDGFFGVTQGKHHVNASIGRNFFDGWSPNEEWTFISQSEPADTNRTSLWKPKEQIFANLQYSLKREKTTYRLFADAFKESILNRGMPRDPYHVSAFDEYYYTNRLTGGIDINGQINEKMHWNVLASYTDYQRTRYTYFKNLTTLNQELTDNTEDHDTTSINTWMSRGAIRYISKDVKVNWELGYDLNNETAFGKRIQDQEQSIGDYALFATAEWRPNTELTVKPGLRYAYNTAYSPPLIPSINFRYAKSKTSYRLSYARGFRAPSLKELYFEFVDVNHNIYGNSELEAESSNNLQFDATYKIVKEQKISMFEVGLFFNDIFDMISLAQMENSVNYTYINVGRFRSQGFELNYNQTLNHWKLSMGFVYTGRSDILSDEVSTNMFYSPELRTALTYEFKKIGGNLAAYYKYNGKIPIYNIDDLGNTEQNYSEAYQMIDIAATKYLWKKRLHWSFGVKNLLDVQNIATATTAGGVHNSSAGLVPISWGRSFFTSLKFNFAWK